MVGGALAIDKLSVENALKELKKEQERTAIRAVIAAKKLVIAQEGIELQDWFNDHAEKMKSFAATVLVADLKGGFTGKAAEAAESALQSVPQPNLTSPIIGG